VRLRIRARSFQAMVARLLSQARPEQKTWPVADRQKIQGETMTPEEVFDAIGNSCGSVQWYSNIADLVNREVAKARQDDEELLRECLKWLATDPTAPAYNLRTKLTARLSPPPPLPVCVHCGGSLHWEKVTKGWCLNCDKCNDDNCGYGPTCSTKAEAIAAYGRGKPCHNE